MAQDNDTPRLTPDAIRVLRDVAKRGCVVFWRYQSATPYYGDGETSMPNADYDTLSRLIKTTHRDKVGHIKGSIEIIEHGHRNEMRYAETWVLPPGELMRDSGDDKFVIIDKQAATQVSSELFSDGSSGDYILSQEVKYNNVPFYYRSVEDHSDYVEFVDATDDFTDDDGDEGVYRRAVLKPLALEMIGGAS